MPHIVIPEEVLEEFLRSLFAKVKKEQEELAAEMLADVEVLRAQLKAGLERKARVAEERIEEIERRACAAQDKLRAFEEEVERRVRACQ
jgi:hypothetical protein